MQNSVSKPKKTIYLIRHGQTDFNKQGIVQGSGVDSDLNNEGQEQARKFYEAHKSVAFDKIYVTELKRTHQSVAPFRAHNIPQEIVPELNEINWGILEGKVPNEENTQAFLSILSKWKEGFLDVSIENGETPINMFARQQQGLTKIMESDFEKILICMHGRAMRSFLCLLTGKHLKDMDDFPHDNLCLYVLEEKENNQFEIIIHNQIDHLQ